MRVADVIIGAAAATILLATAIARAEPHCAIGVRQHGAVVARADSGPFDMASLAKPLTALAVLLLVHDGRVQLDDDVHRWLPELPAYERPITLRQLLTHTSGLRDPDTLGGLAGRGVLDHAAAVQLMFRQRHLNHAPGAREMYTNGGYLLASEIVARVAKQPYDRFVATHIFAPLHMKDSHFIADDGWIGSLDDLLTLDRALDDATILGVPTRELWAPQKLANGDAGAYTLGWERARHRDQDVIEKNGAHGRFRSDWLRFAAQKLTVIALCDDGSPAELVARRHADAYLDRTGIPRAADAVHDRAGPPPTAAEQAALAGTYVADDDVLRIELRDGKLLASQVPFPPVPMEPQGGLRFRLVGPPVTLQFARLRDGAMQLVARSPEGTTTAQRLPPSPAPSLAALVGDYRSDELDVTYHVRRDGERLTVHIAAEKPDELVPLGATLFVDGPFIFRFASTPSGAKSGPSDGFTLSRRRAIGLAFHRVAN
ncbi:MAG TPA: serine hydrolase domain-containing protein [Polyangia bacterium]|nr:serine hydrolase domain-containing protein [Polyangia bacterium]